MKVNINDKVRVKLTPHGEIILSMDEYATDKPDADGWLEMHLWELMRVFGPVMYMGNPNLPFEDNLIELVREVVGQQGCYRMENGEWSNWFDITFNTWVPKEGVRKVREVYA